MKKSFRLAALLMALVLLLGLVPAMAQDAGTETEQTQETPADETTQTAAAEDADEILATLDGEPIMKSDCESFINYYSSSYSLTYAEAVDNLLFQKVIQKLITELGFDQFTDEEMVEINAKAQTDWDDAIASYVDYFLSEDTDEARAAVQQQAIDYYASYGYSFNTCVDNYKFEKAYERFKNYLVDASIITDEDVATQYANTVEQQKAIIGDSAYMYEMYSYYYGDIYYLPSGYRSVLHILLKVDSELLTAYETAKTNYEDAIAKLDAQNAAAEATAEPAAEATSEATAEATAEASAEPQATEAPVTQADVDAAKAAFDAARDAVLASKKTEIDDIVTRLEAGEDFKTLIAQYNEDTGEDVETGYLVHPESIMWDTVFRDAAFSDKMTKIGDHSDPVIGSYGIHVLYYLGDPAQGALPLTDAVRATIRENLYNEKLAAAQQQAYDTRVQSCVLVRNDALINQLDAATEDAAQTEETETTQEPESTAEPNG